MSTSYFRFAIIIRKSAVFSTLIVWIFSYQLSAPRDISLELIGLPFVVAVFNLIGYDVILLLFFNFCILNCKF